MCRPWRWARTVSLGATATRTSGLVSSPARARKALGARGATSRAERAVGAGAGRADGGEGAVGPALLDRHLARPGRRAALQLGAPARRRRGARRGERQAEDPDPAEHEAVQLAAVLDVALGREDMLGPGAGLHPAGVVGAVEGRHVVGDAVVVDPGHGLADQRGDGAGGEDLVGHRDRRRRAEQRRGGRGRRVVGRVRGLGDGGRRHREGDRDGRGDERERAPHRRTR